MNYTGVNQYGVRTIINMHPESLALAKRERILLRKRLRYRKNKEAIRIYARQYRETHKEQEYERKKLWESQNRERIRIRKRQLYALKKGL